LVFTIISESGARMHGTAAARQFGMNPFVIGCPAPRPRVAGLLLPSLHAHISLDGVIQAPGGLMKTATAHLLRAMLI
jgi:hypothetical protein